ncbi:MAG TPA: PaaI family thioesterase [Prolixibacteraceae bacterium]|nr:PaaI family thioesterase [Prolixibacteraceae bacterium]
MTVLEQDFSRYQQQFEKDLFAKNAGIKLVEAAPGYAKARMKISPEHLNSVGVLHGGALFTLADFTFAVASNAHGKVALAIDAEISFFKSVSAGTLTAVAKEISLHSKLGTYLVDIFNEKGELLANFKGTVYRKNETHPFG